MDVWLNPDGTRDREFRPYIEQEELSRSVYLYDPNGPGFNYGLYQSAGQPTCGYWLDVYKQFPSKIPFEVVDKRGRLRMVPPYTHRYDPLVARVRATRQ